MIDAGWMLVVMGVALLAWQRAGAARAENTRLAKLEEWAASWPHPDALLSEIDALSDAVEELGKSDSTLPAVVKRVNDISQDMLQAKTLIAEHRELLNQLRTSNTLRKVGTGG